MVRPLPFPLWSQFFRDSNGEFVCNVRLLAPTLGDASRGEAKAMSTGRASLNGAVGAGPPVQSSGEVVTGTGGGTVAGDVDAEVPGFSTFR